jgi:hypothetical protein
LQFRSDSNPAKPGQSSDIASRLIVAAMPDIRPVAPVTDDLLLRSTSRPRLPSQVAGISMRV